MKKKLLIGFAALALALVAAFNINLNTQKAELSALSLANVEALANGETGGGSNPCYNTITSSPGHQVRYCPTCAYIEGKASWLSPQRNC